MENGNNYFPLDIKDVDQELNKKMLKLFTGEHTGFVQVGPSKFFLPRKYRLEASKIYNLPLRSDDVFVVSFPRSGTTWTQELVWMVANDLDYEQSAAIPLPERYPFLEFSVYAHPITLEIFKGENRDSEHKLKLLEQLTEPATKQLAEAPSPRFIKSHLPLSLLPPKLLDTGKVVYVARDPRDVVVSFYHLTRLNRMHAYVGDFKTFWNYFVNDLSFYTPFFTHLKEAWAQRHHHNLLFLFYEELSKDLPAAVRRVAEFFNKNFSDEDVVQLCDHLSINNFKNNKSVNLNSMEELGVFAKTEQYFIRKGKSGGWRDYFDDEMVKEAELWMADNLRDTDMRFPHLEKQ